MNIFWQKNVQNRRIRGYTLDSHQLFVRLFYWFFGYIDLRIISHKSTKISKIWWKVSRKYSLSLVLAEIKSINRKTFGQKLVRIRGVASDSHILVPLVNDKDNRLLATYTGVFVKDGKDDTTVHSHCTGQY